MEIPTSYENFFAILRGGKAIPYGGGSRPDGTTNYGFRSLKGKVQDIALIPEAQADEALALLLRKINALETGLFSIGCVSGREDHADEHRISGYVEFAINEAELAADAINYFKIFFHFNQRLAGVNFEQRVRFNWELLGATFLDARCDGFTCRIIVNTFPYPSNEEAKRCWSNALVALGDHLTDIKDTGFRRIY